MSIAIPTYNRSGALIATLESLSRQDCIEKCVVTVVDNCSDYDIVEVIQRFDKHLDIKIIKNTINKGMGINLLDAIYYCETEWVWTLSDDDEITKDAVWQALDLIAGASEHTVHIKTQIKNFPNRSFNNIEVQSIKELCTLYTEHDNYTRGDFIFYSNNLIKREDLKKYFTTGYELSGTYVSFMIPVLLALEHKTGSLSFSEGSLVSYKAPISRSYNIGKVIRGMSSLSNLEIEESCKKKILNLLCSIHWKKLYLTFLKNEQLVKYSDILYANRNIYSLTENKPTYFLLKVTAILIKNEGINKLLKKMLNKLGR
ncbi:glycosyltransferase [Porticoccaceae bacterium]|nr:glycosyltransferase [Porticoccaceae bacterium]